MIIGIAGISLSRFMCDVLDGATPILNQYTVVASNWQGKGIGIGSKLLMERINATEGRPAFLVLKVVRGNAPMKRLLQKSSFTIIKEDHNYICLQTISSQKGGHFVGEGLLPCRTWLRFLSVSKGIHPISFSCE